jgi:hypothetical protein
MSKEAWHFLPDEKLSEQFGMQRLGTKKFCMVSTAQA